VKQKQAWSELYKQQYQQKAEFLKFMRGLGVDQEEVASAEETNSYKEPERPKTDFWAAADEEMLELICQTVREQLRHVEQFRMHPAMKDHRSHHPGPGHQRNPSSSTHVVAMSPAKSNSLGGAPTGKKDEKADDLEELLKRWEPTVEQGHPDPEPPQSGMASLVLESAKVETKV